MLFRSGEDRMPGLRRLTDAVHATGAAVSLQLGHCGGFSKLRLRGEPPLGPSSGWNPYGILSGVPRVRAMTEAEMDSVVDAFSTAARRAVDSGVDAIELHLGHGYLLSQWLSPAVNRRRDAHGGSTEARLRFPLRVVEAVRRAVGTEFPVLAKTNVSDGVAGGVEVDEAVSIAVALEAAGVDAIVPSGGLVSQSAFFLLRGARPLGGMIRAERSWAQKAALAMFGPFLVKSYPYTPMFLFDAADRVRQAVRIPVVLLAGVTDAAHLDRAAAAGFGFAAMGRALIANPALIAEYGAGTASTSRCTHCNACVANMDAGVRCVLPAEPATLLPAGLQPQME